MAYKDLERRMEELGRREELEAAIASIREQIPDYANTLSYFLSIVNDLEQNGVRDFAVIGGYGVLAHLVHEAGEGAITQWRGSTDIDMSAQSLSVESVLKGNYEHFWRGVSHFHERKIDLEIGDTQLQEHCVIDMYLVFKGKPSPLQAYQIDEEFWERVELRRIFSLTFPVASKKDLLHMKLAVKKPLTGLPREHDILDIFTLFSLIEEGERAEETWNLLPSYAQESLKVLFRQPNYNSKRLIYELSLLKKPSEQYLEDLMNLAGKTGEF